MKELDAQEITAALTAWNNGERDALNDMMPVIYQRLKQIADRRLHGNERRAIDPTELVNEAMLALLGRDRAFANRAHFLAIAALQMRTILVDRARANALRAGLNVGPATLTTHWTSDGEEGDAVALLALDEALTQLAQADPRAARVMELQCFGGLQRDEIAGVIHVSVPTVDRDLRFANAFVNRALR